MPGDRVPTREVQTLRETRANFDESLTHGERGLLAATIHRAANAAAEVQGYQLDLTQMTQVELQMALDQRSQFMQTLSNILKQIDATSEAITQNLK
jgi:hypothetical protein